MHDSPRTPLDLSRPADEPRLSAEVRSAAAGARRRAIRDGDRQIDTAHLLHSLLESDPRARERCDAGTGGLARVLGYLAQRSIGYGLRWSGSVEDSGALPLVSGQAQRGDTRTDSGWSPAAAGAMRAAVAAAARRGRPQAAGADLLDALLADPACRARQVLRAAGVEVEVGGADGRGPAGPALPGPRRESGGPGAAPAELGDTACAADTRTARAATMEAGAGCRSPRGEVA